MVSTLSQIHKTLSVVNHRKMSVMCVTEWTEASQTVTAEVSDNPAQRVVQYRPGVRRPW
jgi:hypothetical protein